jgi:L-lactate dehydrogenase complex protein LldG
VDAFTRTFQAAGGEVVRVEDEAGATAWLAAFSKPYATAVVGTTVPAALTPPLEDRRAADAELGISLAACAIGETGSLLLGAGDGRLAQLLPPTHVVFVHDTDVVPTLRDALLKSKEALPSAVGLHSGPSKSADIGQILVKGVHGPGRVIAVVVGGSR